MIVLTKELDLIQTEMRAAELPLKETATHLVFGKGNPKARIMIIGEAPGRREDLQGEPFVGAAGKQLDRFLGMIGLSLDDVYITNILKYRPPENRNPRPHEIEAHTPYLIRQIEAIAPEVLLTLGNFSTKYILGGCRVEEMDNVPGISRIHGEVREVHLGGVCVRVCPLYHPAAILYRPPLRSLMEEDFLRLGEWLRRG